MNNPDNIPVDIAEQREWISNEKARLGISWPQLATRVGIPSGTLSPFAAGQYQGNNERIAREVYKYRQTVASQAERADGLLLNPGYFQTPTSRRLRGLLIVAHMGRITVGATSPGTGKTMEIEEYAASTSNCWVATMRPSMKTLNAMMAEVLRAIGVDSKGAGWGSKTSRMISSSMANRRGLLIVDEANNLSLEQMEELRSWHDVQGGAGLAFFGNEELLMRIRSGSRSDQFARLNSRIAASHIQNLPDEEDVDCFCDAWGLVEPAMRQMLKRIALTPGAGGLRECRQIVEQASMLASDEERPLSFADMRDAQSGRATKHIRTN
jgi:DNA transposition AAA+ family ATPase